MGSGLSGLTDVLAPQNEPFNPSIADARLATVILSARLPPELALLVLDYAFVPAPSNLLMCSLTYHLCAVSTGQRNRAHRRDMLL